jgi:hypothetical protein
VPVVDHFSPTVVMAAPLPVAPTPPAPPLVSPTATLSRQRVPAVTRTQPTRPPEELLDLSFPSRTEAVPVPLPRPDPGAPRKAALRSNVEWYGPYLLLRRVAVGGMAELFMAKQGGVSGFEKVVAIKRLFPHLVRDHELVEMAAAIPGEAKLRGGTLKHLMKQALADQLPADILHRKKRGFGTPMGAWLKRELAPVLLELLSPAVVRQRGLFRAEVVTGIVADHEANRADGTDALLSLLNLEVWSRVYLDGRAHTDVADELHRLAGHGMKAAA